MGKTSKEEEEKYLKIQEENIEIKRYGTVDFNKKRKKYDSTELESQPKKRFVRAAAGGQEWNMNYEST